MQSRIYSDASESKCTSLQLGKQVTSAVHLRAVMCAGLSERRKYVSRSSSIDKRYGEETEEGLPEG